MTTSTLLNLMPTKRPAVGDAGAEGHQLPGPA